MNAILPPTFLREAPESTTFWVRPPVAVVSISGGKDSNATALEAINRYGRDRVRLVHADTGHEHPITSAYVRDYLPGALGLPIEIVKADFSADFARKRLYIAEHWPAKGVPPERIDRALELLHPTGNPFLDLCLMKGMFPRRKAQFCTEFLKRNPLDAYMVGLAKAGLLVESWQGVRRDESERRKDALDWERSDWGWMIHRPIAAWTADQTFECMAKHGIKPNPLYSQGLGRVGCMPCINCQKDELREIDMRWPEEIARVVEWERLVSQTGKKGAATLLQRQDHEEGSPPDVVFAKERIEAQVEWAMTSRGGKQFDLLRAIPSLTCSSSYGLCE